MNYSEQYSNFLKQIESRIIEIIPIKEPQQLYEPFRYIMKEGGKRLRPVLTMISAGVVGGEPQKAIDSAVALEILHNFTLVHDDIMDNSPMRRGRMTIHKKWDSDIAILTGDVMIGYAYKLLPDSKTCKYADEIIKIFTNELIEVCEGQVLDMSFNNRKDVEMSDYIEMIDKKTARLIETSALIGAYIGEGTIEEIEIIGHIARNIGIAFQIQDDLLDMTAKQSEFGKKIGNDILEGKKTFLILKAKEIVASDTDIELINKFFENNGLNENEISAIDELFSRNGIYEYAQDEINSYFDKSYEKLESLKQNFYTEMLADLLKSVNKRIV